MRRKVLAGIGGMMLGAVAWPCAGPDETPKWAIAKGDYDPYGSGAILLPGNDTRANMLLLLADRNGVPVRAAGAKHDGPGLVFMPWKIMREQAVLLPPDDEATASAGGEGTRCQTTASGATAFVAALNASRASADEKSALASARNALMPDCQSSEVRADGVETSTAAGRAFAAYLNAAADFYGGRFDEAARQFAALGKADDPWVRETANYMVARTLLNAAQEGALNEWGGLNEADKRDAAGARAAGAAFADYLTAYPKGRYAASAHGLIRRVHWLAGDEAALAEELGRTFAGIRSAAGAATLVEETDYKLLTDLGGKTASDPLLLAVIDLERMRGEDPYGQKLAGAPISLAQLEAQAAVFSRDKALFDYLRAAHAMFVANDPRAVLSLIPDAAHQPRFTYLEFSRQMLRGMALDAIKDSNARGFWLSLLPGAVQPYQRDAVALGIALHDEKDGKPERVFAAASPVTHPVMRDLLLEFTAGPALLRQQAGAAPTAHEQRVALYILLAKQLQRGFYTEFVRDLALIPANASAKGDDYWWGAQHYNTTYSDELTDPPLSTFAATPKGTTGCPAVKDVATSLVANPRAVRPRLCLAEYMRTQGFDNFEFDTPGQSMGLGSGPSQFPGKPYVRMAEYQKVLADPAASSDDKAFALNRMVRCYAPSGYSSCGGPEIGKDGRKSWFERLKRDYPTTRWAKELRYYW